MTSTVRVKHLCEMRSSATILSVTGPCDFSRLPGEHEQLRRDRWKKALRRTPEHHQCLLMHAKTATASLPCHSFLDGLPSNMTLDSATTSVLCYHGSKHAGKQLPSCMIFFKRVVTPVMSIWLLFHYFATRWLQLVAMADDRHGMVHQGRTSRIGRGGFEQATNGFLSLLIRSSQPCTLRAKTRAQASRLF